MARTSVFIIAAAVWLAACRDGIGPPDASSGSDRVPHHLRWSPQLGAPTFAVLGGERGFVGLEAPGAATLRVLDRYQASFWARRGASTGVQIRYQARDGTWQPYIRLTVPSGALRLWPDGSRVADGDSVLITLALDSMQLVVQLEPTGLVFDPTSPAQLDVWYTGADPDLDGSGAVDATDRYIESSVLGVWMQARSGSPWREVSSAHWLDRKLFTASLGHFSGYAVSH
jgi:hypothetical protein